MGILICNAHSAGFKLSVNTQTHDCCCNTRTAQSCHAVIHARRSTHWSALHCFAHQNHCCVHQGDNTGSQTAHTLHPCQTSRMHGTARTHLQMFSCLHQLTLPSSSASTGSSSMHREN
jgi:hypothetical protein